MIAATPARPGCPADRVLQFLARAWTAHVILALADAGTLHFAALRRALPGRVSARVLSLRLKALREAGLVEREPSAEPRREVRYRLTEDGRALDRLMRRIEGATRGLRLP
jgi:DNA-binding HxlR family transcriptional regulator